MELISLIENEFRLTSVQKSSLNKLKLYTIKDLLYHFPSRYGDIKSVKHIRDLKAGENAVIYGTLLNLDIRKTWKSKTPVGEGVLQDPTGQIKIMWFHQPYIAKMIHPGEQVKLAGKVTQGRGEMYIANPELEKIPFPSGPMAIRPSPSQREGEGGEEESSLYPIYPEVRGITSRWFYHAIQKVIKSKLLENIKDHILEEIIKRYNLPILRTALIWIHAPQKESDTRAARKRFAFEEVFFIQLTRQQQRSEYKKNKSFALTLNEADKDNFLSRFPFTATNAQQKAIDRILKDLSKKFPMSRLLEGDVGSGKTLVAAVASYAVINNRPPKPAVAGSASVATLASAKPPAKPGSAKGAGYGPLRQSLSETSKAKPASAESSGEVKQDFGNLQVAYMAPTEILANQHFESFIEYFKHLPINIGLITSSGCRKFPSKVNPSGWTKISRNQLLKWVANGEIPILIGTHSLIQKTVAFKDLALVIIDEQHRFGTQQRSKLARKDGFAPHLLSMTATPIPRTLALTVFGDLDLTLIDEMPPGRKTVITTIVTPRKREEAYQKIEEEIAKGRQVYIICPRIEEPDPTKALALNVKSVKTEAERLKKEVFPDKYIDILHSKMSKDEKERVMQEFAQGKIDILVATSVIEVGVNIPNATTIVIEGAERFGLAQLHQLRGRVLRSEHQAYCFIFTDSKTQKTLERLQALKTAKNGFELSELDLELRGAGELTGAKQWGISDIGMEAIKNIKMVEAARTEAQEIIKNDPKLDQHPELKSILEEKNLKIHFE